MVYTKGVKEDKEYTAMINFLKAKKETNIAEKIESETWVFEADEVSLTTLAKEMKEVTKKAEESRKKLEAAKEASKIIQNLTQPTDQEEETTLAQLSKDVENKVAGSEQKYVEYVDKYPELRKDTKVKVMYEKCKAKIKK